MQVIEHQHKRLSRGCAAECGRDRIEEAEPRLVLLIMLGWLARAIARIDVKVEKQTAGLRAEIQALDERMDGKFAELYECLRGGYVTHDLCAAYRQALQTQEDE